MISGGFLYHIGQAAFWPTYLALVAGDFLADVMWYWVGYWGARPFFNRFGHIFGLTPDVILKIERRFNLYHDWILAISKLTMGFGLALATLTVAGMLRMPFWRYALINLVCGFVWTFILFGLGYLFGNAYELIPGYFKIIFLALSIIAVFAGLKIASKKLATSEW